MGVSDRHNVVEVHASPAESTAVMRQAVLREPRHIELVTLPVPAPGPGEVVLRVRAALTCGTDLKTYRRGHPKVPFGPFGHECAGDVVAVGREVRGVREGDAAVPLPTAPCGQCAACRRGRHNLCERQFEGIVLGAYADYLLVSEKVAATHLLSKPSGLSYIEAAFLEPLSCVVHAWSRLRPTPVEQVAVVGLGGIGFLHIRMAKAMGVRVIAVGRRRERLALAAAMGADAVVDTEHDDVARKIRDAGDGQGPDVVIECTGSARMWVEVAGWARRGGRVLLFAGLAAGAQVAFDATRLHYDEVDIINSFHYRPADVEEAHRLLATRAIDVRPIVSGVRDLPGIADVFASLDRGHGVKYAILPEAVGWT
ncbi:MAG: zinc-binding dehydrogenase [Armatimonadota bacterium]|nr:zinc-binding dehydrogenase [Armatimonadota bacterium]MDR7451340.1 zinc-binding dehydrogenase [Armatimonadota bacterium]MDR7468251.1 zinc-binding dehydrogenase [Armatimonadota bacterium]MDR7495281.1 zinc-binding dehydrogenase [Armatimonadota bacterium]MDR7500449.1 zinc-binding dehydrogenase [Armatimonadota bacterium]